MSKKNIFKRNFAKLVLRNIGKMLSELNIKSQFERFYLIIICQIASQYFCNAFDDTNMENSILILNYGT